MKGKWKPLVKNLKAIHYDSPRVSTNCTEYKGGGKAEYPMRDNINKSIKSCGIQKESSMYWISAWMKINFSILCNLCATLGFVTPVAFNQHHNIKKNINNNYLYYLGHGLKWGTSVANQTNTKYTVATPKYGQIDNTTKKNQTKN